MGDSMYDTQDFSDAARQAATNMDYMVGCLGSDLDHVISEMMGIIEDKKKLASFRKQHWEVLRKVVVSALKTALGTRLSEEDVLCWETCYDNVSRHLIELMEEEKDIERRRRSEDKSSKKNSVR